MPRSTRYFNLVEQVDTALNDSDKTLTVTAAREWLVRYIYAKLISTATVGNRQLDILITDGSDVPLGKYRAGAVQAASLTREYIFAPGLPQDTSFDAAGVMYRTFPYGFVLPAGYKIRIFDSAAIDAAADDLTIRVMVEELKD